MVGFYRARWEAVGELFVGVYNGPIAARAAMGWIWQNKEWLFSGAGISGLAVLLWVARILRARKATVYGLPAPPSTLQVAPALQPPTSMQAQLPHAPRPLGRFTTPTPHDIKEQIRSVPPYQRRNAARAYEGLRVCWLTEFSGVQQDPNELNRAAYDRGRAEATGEKAQEREIPWLVTLGHHQAKSYGIEIVSCYGVDPSTYPELKVIHEKTPVAVSGTIRSINPNVDLVDVVLDFPDGIGHSADT